MTRASLFLAAFLMGAALALVTARFQARELFMTLERMRNQARELDADWRQLQWERAQETRHARIDRVARQTLKMAPRTPDRVLYVKPGSSP